MEYLAQWTLVRNDNFNNDFYQNIFMCNDDKALAMQAPASVTLSLILCTLNRVDDLYGLFESLGKQSFLDFEVIVIDQNRDDRLIAVIQHARELGLNIMHYQIAKQNLSIARNVGITLSRGRWLGFPDDDCWYEPDMLEKLRHFFCEGEPLRGVVAHWYELGEKKNLPEYFSWDRSVRFRDRMAASFMIFFDRRVFDLVGGFNPQLGVGLWAASGEETDLVIRALRRGAHMSFQPNAIVHHPVKKFGLTDAGRKTILGRARGVGAIYALHRMPWFVILRGLIGPLLKQMRDVICFRKVYDFAEPWLTTIGRLQGFLRWQKIRSLPTVDVEAAESVFEMVTLVNQMQTTGAENQNDQGRTAA